ncbi:transposase [Adhaeretor mobilis]|uniref:Transposase n=1 Tax=Adhaeretor mobilis TaxID=1930276 RepID=A0A517MW44_9BACT|nr:transposase [Adhaeretor mobilis]QDS99088.1 Transposase [Adhaeretor mobilis]
MAKKKRSAEMRTRRTFTREFKQQAVQMMVDGYSASSVSDNLGIGNTDLLYRWKAELVSESGPVTETLDKEVSQLREQLRRTQRERDILKKALGILSQQE